MSGSEGAIMTTPFLTDLQREQLLANGRARAAGDAIDPQPVVRYFTPDAHATWMFAELDPADEDVAYGLIDLGLGNPELGHARLSMLKSIRGPNDLRVMRDIYFAPHRTLSEYLRLAVENGSVID